MRFEKCTDSRWLSMGSSMRSLCASLLLGLEALVHHVRQQPHVSDFYPGGLKEALSLAHMQEICNGRQLLQLSTRLILDGGAGRQPSSHAVTAPHQLVEEELEFLKHLPLALWNLLGQFVDQAGSPLRGDVLQASHVALAYLDSKVLQVARRFPWCMCSGDLLENFDWSRSSQTNQKRPQPRRCTDCCTWGTIVPSWWLG